MIFFVGVFNKFTEVSGFTNRIFAKAQGTSASCTSNYILHSINFQDTRIINGSALRLQSYQAFIITNWDNGRHNEGMKMNRPIREENREYKHRRVRPVMRITGV